MRQLKITQQITHRESRSLNKYLNEVGTINLISQDDEITISERIKAGDEEAFKQLVESNLRFVISVAKQYPAKGVKLDDLIQAGNLGLMVAARRFDASRGFKFISYAVWWIRQSITQFLTESGRTIYMPSNRIGTLNKIKNITSILEQELQREPSTEEIVERLSSSDNEFTSQEINWLMAINSNPSSLDMSVKEDSETCLADLLITEPMNDVNAILKQNDLQITCKRIIDKRLTPKERQIIISYYGLFNQPQKSLEEIGTSLELTRERVRQIKEKALMKLRSGSSKKIIKEFL